MLSAVVDAANSAAKDSTTGPGPGQTKRLETARANLESSANEVLAAGMPPVAEGKAESGGLQDALSALLRRAKDVAAELSFADADAARKALREKDLFYKLK